MKNPIPAKRLHATLRLVCAGVLNIVIWFLNAELNFWHPNRTPYSLGALFFSAAIATVILIPILFRGDGVQRLLASVLSAYPLFFFVAPLWIFFVER